MPTADIKAIAEGLSEAQRRHLRASKNAFLSQIATTRRILIGRQDLVDYSFRPARVTALGLSVREYLEKHNG